MGADIFFHVATRPTFAPQTRKTLKPWFKYPKGTDPMDRDLGYYYRDNYNEYSLARLARWAGKDRVGEIYFDMPNWADDAPGLAAFFGGLASVTNTEIDAYVATVIGKVYRKDYKKPMPADFAATEVAWFRAKRDYLKAILKAKILRVDYDC
jgi:hypothetical protein